MFQRSFCHVVAAVNKNLLRGETPVSVALQGLETGEKINYVDPQDPSNQGHEAVDHVSCQFKKLRLGHYSDIVLYILEIMVPQ